MKKLSLFGSVRSGLRSGTNAIQLVASKLDTILSG
jgi:hypothetical protein